MSLAHPSRSRRTTIAAVIVAVVLVLVAAVVLVRATAPEVVSVRSCRVHGPLNPTTTADECGYPIVDAITARVTRFDTATGRTAPDLAESVTTTDDQEFTIRLAADRRFSDGSPVTSAHLVRAWNHLVDCRNALSAAVLLGTVEGFEESHATPCEGEEPPALSGLTIVDDHTLIVRTSAPDPTLPERLSHPATAPLPDAFYADPAALLPVGAGPFVVAENHDTEVVLERSPTYAGPFPAGVDEIRLPVYIDGQEAYNDVRDGRLDVTEIVPADRLADPRVHGDAFESGPPDLVLQGLRINDPRLTDPRLRRALSLAIDRDFLAERLFDGTRTSVPCGADCAYDPAAARALWDAAGGIEGPLHLWGTWADADYPVLDTLCNEWEVVLGINCRVAQARESQELQARSDAGLQDGIIRWNAPRFIGGTAAEVNRYVPLARWSETNDDVRAALRAQDAQALDEALTDTRPVVPLWFSEAPYLASSDVTGVRLTPMATIDLPALRAG